jgi:two-component system, cell cycle sensor histidine kinase and response regulator CckA
MTESNRESDMQPQHGVQWSAQTSESPPRDAGGSPDELRESEAKYRRLVETSNDLIWSVDAAGCWTFLNRKAALAIYGYEPEELIGRPFTDLVPEDQLLKDVAAFVSIKSGRSVFRYPTHHCRKDGRLVHLLFNAVPLVDADGNPAGTTGTATDITERVKLEAELLQAQKVESIGRLAGGVAHDFNNLLTSILGFAELARLEAPGSNRARRHLSSIIEAAERGAALTQQLLSFARRRVVAPETIDARAQVAAMAPILERLLGADIELSVESSREELLVRIDPGSLDQIVMNLAVNARDAMPSGGRLALTTSNRILDEGAASQRANARAGEYVVIEVRDTGHGMTEDTMSRIFEPFFTTKPAGQGTGLGLSVCHGAVSQAGGFIVVETEVGHGSTFAVHLPRVFGGAPTETRTEVDSEWVGGTESILLVDDDPLIRRLASEVLGGLGYRVTVTVNGVDALGALTEPGAHFDLIITDVVMPKLGGKELAKEVVSRGIDVPILFVSAYAEEATVSDVQAEPSFDFLRKPYSLDELVARVRELIDRPREN